MYNHSISSLLSTALLSLTAALAPVWAQARSNLPPAENSGLEKTKMVRTTCSSWPRRSISCKVIAVTGLMKKGTAILEDRTRNGPHDTQ
jgi:hypothetical protein